MEQESYCPSGLNDIQAPQLAWVRVLDYVRSSFADDVAGVRSSFAKNVAGVRSSLADDVAEFCLGPEELQELSGTVRICSSGELQPSSFYGHDTFGAEGTAPLPAVVVLRTGATSEQAGEISIVNPRSRNTGMLVDTAEFPVAERPYSVEQADDSDTIPEMPAVPKLDPMLAYDVSLGPLERFLAHKIHGLAGVGLAGLRFLWEAGAKLYKNGQGSSPDAESAANGPNMNRRMFIRRASDYAMTTSLL